MLSVEIMSEQVVALEHFALEEREVEQALARVNVRAVDYADIYFESTISESVSMEEGIVKRAVKSISQGARIRATAYEPRPGRGGWWESRATARRRGSVDVALISLMRDAMLRVSEAAALTWADIAAEPDGTGRLLIRRSKTDPEGAGAIAFLAAPTMALLDVIRAGATGRARVFGLHRNQMTKRIKQAAHAAGLGELFSGHSPKVGMARDLARAGIELPRLMTAGRWRSPDMPALYIRNETAGSGAVAQFYRHRRPSA